MQRLTITIDDDLVAEVDEFIARHGYANRSEAFRDLLRGGLERGDAATAGNRNCIATPAPNKLTRSEAFRLANWTLHRCPACRMLGHAMFTKV